MWVAKIKLKDEKDIYSPLCMNYKIEFFAYPFTFFKKNKKINLIVVGIIYGERNSKKRFIRALKKDKRVKKIEQSKDFILVHAVHPLTRETITEITTFYNPQYILIKPVHISSDGWEYWQVACLNRNELNKLIKAAEKHYNGRLFSIKEEKLSSISILNIFPDLTEKQKQTLELAFKEGYYEYPKKITLPDLAKLSKCSYSTFQEHLKKAEKKVIESFLKLL